MKTEIQNQYLFMNIKNKLRKILLKAIFKRDPIGIDPYTEIQNNFKDYNFEIFFDIGANIGQTISSIRNVFPNSQIWAFEPVQQTFGVLKANMANKNVHCFQIGFGSENMETEIYVNRQDPLSTSNSIVNETNNESNSEGKQKIRIEKLDTFCENHSISKIDYLKIDTEGFDLEVLKGSCELLKNEKISFIEVEVSTSPENSFHVKYEAVKEYLENHSYRIFGIYEQVLEWTTKTPYLRRVNVLFVSKNLTKNK